MVESVVSVLTSGRSVTTTGVPDLISGRLRRMVRDVFGNTSGMRTRGVPRVVMSLNSWSAMSSTLVSACVAQCSLLMQSHGSSHILGLHLTGLSRLLLRLVSSPCHPCPLDACATLAGIDHARDRLWKSPFNMVAELTLSGTS